MGISNHTSVQLKIIFESDTGHISRKAYNVRPHAIGCPVVAKIQRSLELGNIMKQVKPVLMLPAPCSDHPPWGGGTDSRDAHTPLMNNHDLLILGQVLGL